MNGRPLASALVDTVIFRLAITVQSVVQKQTIVWGGIAHQVPVAGMVRKPPRDRWMQDQIEAIPTIARLVREGAVRLGAYNEIEFELMKGSFGFSGAIGDLFSGVQIDDVPAAIERSHFESTEMSEYVQKASVIAFCKFLLTVDYGAFESRPKLMSRLTEFERNNLRRLPRFREICRDLPEKHYPDAFHLWTAEVNGFAYFLTADKAFINAMTLTSRVALTTKPIATREFLATLHVTVLDPMPISGDGFHQVFD
jgi:hypothetical protein